MEAEDAAVEVLLRHTNRRSSLCLPRKPILAFFSYCLLMYVPWAVGSLFQEGLPQS
jgi:hypothetical protein